MTIVPKSRPLALLAALSAAATGFWALIAWRLDEWHLVSLGADFIPMAPLSALLFAVLGLALAAQERWPESRPVRFAGVAGAVLALGVSSPVILQSWFDFDLPWDDWLVRAPASVGKIPVGQMSPVTALCFLFTAGVLLVECLRWTDRPAVRRAAYAANVAALAVASLMALSYVTGTPLFYGAGIVPMALLTALAFLALNGSLFLSGLLDRLLQKWRAHDTAAYVPDGGRAYSRRLALVSGVLGGLIILAGIHYLRREQATVRLVVYQQLEAIAQLKVREIGVWRNERLGEARFLYHTSAVVQDIAAFAARPGDSAARARVLDWLEPIKGGDRYQLIALLDPQARPLLTIPAGSTLEPANCIAPALFARALASPGPVFNDLQRDAGDPAPHLDLLVPIHPRAGTDSRQAPTVAVVVLRLDPRHFLYPLIQSWPLPSATAESLLVRREGDEMVFLNEVRHRPDLALNLRRPVSDPALPAARAGRGETGVFEGVDYRGVPVLSASHLIPETPWILIAKIDQAEAYEAMRHDAWQTGLAVLLLLLTVLLAGISLWRWRHASFLRRALATEQERQALAERLGLVLRQANDIILVFDEHMRIMEANERALAAYGRTAEEMQQLTVRELRAPGSKAATAGDFTRVLREKGAVFETIHCRADGSEFPVEVSSRPFEIAGRRHVLSIIRDITERKTHEQEIKRLNRMYIVISEVNQTIVRAKSQSGLFPEICRVLVEFGRFKVAWFGWPTQAAQRLVPVAIAGDAHGYVRDLKVSLDPAVPESRWPSGTAFRENRTCVCNDFFADPALRPWHEQARASGINACIALPLRQGGTVRGVLSVYATEKDFFGSTEIKLLEAAVDNVSFALDVFDGEARRQEAEAALRVSEERLRLALTASRQGLFDLNVQTGEAVVSPEYALMLGYDPDTFHDTNAGWMERLHPDERESATAAYRDYVAGKSAEYRAEFRQRTRSGRWIWILSLGRIAKRSPDGTPLRMLGINTDITERKQAEAALQQSQDRLQSIFRAAPVGIGVVANRIIQEANEVLCKMTGYARAELLGESARMLYPTEEEFTFVGREKYRQIAEKGTGVVETRWRRKNGEVIDVSLSSTPFDAADLTRGITFAVLDITGRKQSEAALRESQVLYSTLVEQLPVGVFRKDPAGRYVFVSPWFCRFQGMKAEDFLGRTAREVADVETVRRAASGRAVMHTVEDGEHHRRIMETGKSIELVEEFPLSDGRKQFVHAIKSPVMGPDGKIIGSQGILFDITAGKQAEAALRESESMLKEAQSIASLGSYDLDLATGRWFSSATLDRVFGIDQTYERSVAGWIALLHPEDQARMANYLRHEVNGRHQPFDWEYRIIRQTDRAERWVWGAGKLDLDAQGRPGRVRGTIQDITERKQAELELQKLSRVVEQSPTSVVITDLKGTIEYVNPWFTTLTGYTIAEVRGQNPRILKSGDTPAEVYRDLWQTLAANRTWRGELRNRKKNGELFIELAVIAPVFGPDGGPSHYVAIKEDITERKRLETLTRKTLEHFNSELEKQVAQRTEELAARTRQMQALLNSIPDTVMRLRADGTVLHSQPAHQGAAALAATTPATGVPPAAGAPAGLLAASLALGRRALAEGATAVGEIELATPGGTLALELHTTPTGADEFVVFARDITSRKRLEGETAAMLEKERQVSEMKTRFIAVISHEFRTPMTAIAGSIELLANHLDRLSPEKRMEILERIKRSQIRMTTMLDDVLTLNRVESNHAKMRLAKVDLEPFLQNIISEIRAADHDAHRFVLELAGTTADFVTDPNQLNHIVANLLGNAVRYSPVGTTVTVCVTRDAWRLHLSIEDQGIGIPLADRIRIFEPFERGSNVSHIKGTGLGLNIVKRLTELLGGSITLRPLAGGGTRFNLALPLLTPPPDSTP